MRLHHVPSPVSNPAGDRAISNNVIIPATDVLSHDAPELSAEAILRIIDFGIVTIATDALAVLSANHAAEQLFGRVQSALLGQPLDTLLKPVDQSLPDVRSVMENGRGRLLLRGTGHDPVAVEVWARRVQEGTDQVYVAVLKNAAGWAFVEKEVRTAALHYDNLAANVPGVVYQRVLHADGSVSYPYVSSGAYDIFGYTAEEIMADNKILRGTLFDEERDEFNAGFARSAQTLESMNWAGRAKRKDDGIRWVQLSARPRRLANGDTLWDGLILDITIRKRTEDALRASERHFHTIVDAAPAMIAYLDKEKRYQVANRTMSDWVRQPNEKIVGKTPREIFGETTYEGMRPQLERVLAGEQLEYEEARKFPDGVTRMLDTTLVPDIREDGAVQGWFVLARDITARKRAEEELRQSEEELQHYHQRLNNELEMARDMQEALLPSNKTVQSAEAAYGCKLQSYFETSSELGGDFWGIQCLDEWRFAIFAADFTGHGIGAAVNTFRLHALMADAPSNLLSPGAYLSSLNRQLVHLIPRGQFATMIYAIVNTAADVVTYASAGAPNPIFGIAGDDELIIGEASGIPLGISDKATYPDICVRFPLGAFLFLYSDALFESPCLTGDPLEQEGVIDLVRRHRMSAGIMPLHGVLQEFKSRTPITLPDDLTTIWLARFADPAA